MHRLSRRSPLLVAAACLASALAAGDLAAQTLTFDDIVGSNYTPIPAAYGSTANLSVTNRARDTFGNGTVNAGGLCLWATGNYGDLVNNAFTCSAGAGVGEFTFVPTAGWQVTLNSLEVGEYLGRVGGNAEVRVFDLALTNTLFAASQALTGTGHWSLAPNVTSAQGLVLQWGDNWDYGVDNVSLTVSRVAPPTTPVPEPMTVALVGAGLVAMGGVARARRRA